jgi:hypothetical protein
VLFSHSAQTGAPVADE